MTRLDKAIKFAMDSMPMKYQAFIVAKALKDMDSEERRRAVVITPHQFYASVSITVGRKEYSAIGFSDCDRTGAVCHAFAKLHLETVTKQKPFLVSESFVHQFLVGLGRLTV